MKASLGWYLLLCVNLQSNQQRVHTWKKAAGAYGRISSAADVQLLGGPGQLRYNNNRAHSFRWDIGIF